MGRKKGSRTRASAKVGRLPTTQAAVAPPPSSHATDRPTPPLPAAFPPANISTDRWLAQGAGKSVATFEIEEAARARAEAAATAASQLPRQHAMEPSNPGFFTSTIGRWMLGPSRVAKQQAAAKAAADAAAATDAAAAAAVVAAAAAAKADKLRKAELARHNAARVTAANTAAAVAAKKASAMELVDEPTRRGFSAFAQVSMLQRRLLWNMLYEMKQRTFMFRKKAGERRKNPILGETSVPCVGYGRYTADIILRSKAPGQVVGEDFLEPRAFLFAPHVSVLTAGLTLHCPDGCDGSNLHHVLLLSLSTLI
mgnify:FL=1